MSHWFHKITFIAIGLLALASAPAATNSTADDARPHPWLFLTGDDVQRARQAVKQSRAFSALAKDLTETALTNRLEKLPALETEWWEAARSKPWKHTYPEIYHHSWKVPGQWSALALNCARGSLLSHSSELAKKGKEVLLGLSAYTFAFEHFDVGMNYTVWGAEALEAYDILYTHFDRAERAKMDAFFMRLLAAVQKSDAYWVKEEPGGTVNNHYAWHKLCYVMLGLFYDRPELVEQAFSGPKGMEFMLQHGFKDDGLWIEGSIPYQFAATEPMLQMAELLENDATLNRTATKHTGEPVKQTRSLYALETKDGRSLTQSYRALLPLLWPDRTLPTIGDAYGLRPHLGTHSDFEILFRRFREPSFGWLLADRRARSSGALFGGLPVLKPSAAPSQASKLWPEMGYIALRSNEGTNYWSGEGCSVFATFSNRPIHQHADKLSLGLFAEGHLWLPDIEERAAAEHAFSSAVQAQLNRQTVSHNTLLVDGESQRLPRQPLELIEFSTLPHVKRATFGDLRGQLYSGVRQLRTVIVTTNYVLDFFQVQSDQARQLTWLTHVDGKSVACSVRDFAAAKLPSGPAWLYLGEAQSAGIGKHFSETFTHDGAPARPAKLFQLDLWSDNPLEIVRCGFPLTETAKPDMIPMRLAQSKTAKAWFLALYRLGSGSVAPVEATVEPGPLNTWKISFHNGAAFAEEKGSSHDPVAHIVPRLTASP